MFREIGGPSPEKIGNETQEQHIKKIDDFCYRISEEEIDTGTYSGNIKYHIKIGRSQKDVRIDNGTAFFEVPLNLFMQNEDDYRCDDTMNLTCEINLSDWSLQITGKQNEDGKPYQGDLDKWHDDAVEYIRKEFSAQ